MNGQQFKFEKSSGLFFVKKRNRNNQANVANNFKQGSKRNRNWFDV